jgi:hypothetical protein
MLKATAAVEITTMRHCCFVTLNGHEKSGESPRFNHEWKFGLSTRRS